MADSGEKFLYFLIGGFVGAAVGLLLAPKSGEETRELLTSKYREGTERLSQRVKEGRDLVNQKARSAADRFAETVERGRDTVARQKEQLAAAIEAGKRAYHEEKDKLGDLEGSAGESASRD